jgi:tetratricopeptide (TPR) repeat protein
LALGAVALVLGLGEGTSRLLGLFPAPPGGSSLPYQSIALPLFTPAELADGRSVLATTDPRLPFQWIEAQKPAGERRIFFFGGSALAGLGHTPNVALPRELEELLEGLPGAEQLRIYNLGVVAFATRQLRALVADVLAHGSPDLLVVYEANNEFLELHSRAYARATGQAPSLASRLLGRSHLLRGLTGRHKLDRARLEASVSTRSLAQNDARVDHSAMIERIAIDPAEVEAVYAEYEANLHAIAAAAKTAGVPLLLCSVASNWEWIGVAEKSAVERLGYGSGSDPQDAGGRQALLERIEAEIAAGQAGPKRRWELEYEAARQLDALGQREAANQRLRKALEIDPHCRRATPKHAEILRRVVTKSGCQLFDLAAWAEARGQGRVGFDIFYDYVHFTPLGIAEATRALADRLFELGLLEGLTRPAAWPNTANQRAATGATPLDGLAVGEFLGFGSQPQRLSDRSLWKYDRTLDELDAGLKANPEDYRQLCWRGNAAFFRSTGLADAQRDYQAAAEAAASAQASPEEQAAIADNLQRLNGARRP